MKKKTAKTAAGPEAIRARIMGLDMKSFVNLGVGEFMLLREGADFEGRKKLDYLMRRGEIEGFARGVVREELAKAAKR
jgi:hypothetical protein